MPYGEIWSTPPAVWKATAKAVKFRSPAPCTNWSRVISSASILARSRSKGRAGWKPGIYSRKERKGLSRMPESATAKKMKLKPGLKAAVINAPEKYLGDLKHDTAISSTLSGKFDWVQIFVKNKAELEALAPKAAKALKPESTLWISFPKGASKIQ